MPHSTLRLLRSVLQTVAVPAGWIAVGGLLLLAALWASEPGGADPPASSWKAGRTATTWDWERHWNHWKEWECAGQGMLPGGAIPVCLNWSQVGPVWKPCGPVISPPRPGVTNSCNIGQPGGHSPHGDGLAVKYTYLGRHEDRTGPTYAVCVGAHSLPADTSPGNCGTWVNIPHEHCEDDPDSHPPDCPPPTDGPPPTEGPAPTEGVPPIDGPGPTRPPESRVCEDPEAFDAFLAAVEDRPTPGLGLQPTANGYVRVPMRALYTDDPRFSLSTRINGDQVILRSWVSHLSWSFTDLGTLDGTDLGNRTFHRYAHSFSAARSLTSPVTVDIGGTTVVYRRSSLRGGYNAGYPIILEVVWQAECRESGTSAWTDLGEETWRYRHSYKVYAIRSRPG